MPVMCNDCPHDFIADLPATLIVLVPRDPELSLVGGCLCRRRCLVREDVLEFAVTFDQFSWRKRSRSVDAVLSWPCSIWWSDARPENAHGALAAGGQRSIEKVPVLRPPAPPSN